MNALLGSGRLLSLRNLLACTATQEAEDVALERAEEWAVECRASQESNAPISSPISECPPDRECLDLSTDKMPRVSRVHQNDKRPPPTEQFYVSNNNKRPPSTEQCRVFTRPPSIERCRTTSDERRRSSSVGTDRRATILSRRQSTTVHCVGIVDGRAAYAHFSP